LLPSDPPFSDFSFRILTIIFSVAVLWQYLPQFSDSILAEETDHLRVDAASRSSWHYLTLPMEMTTLTSAHN
jgi:hypothetical protein